MPASHDAQKKLRGRREKPLGSLGQPISSLGYTLRTWRKHLGLSMTELAERAQLGKSGGAHISKIEHGYVKHVRSSTLAALAEGLGGIDVDVLRNGTLPSGQTYQGQPALDPLSHNGSGQPILAQVGEVLLAAARTNPPERILSYSQRGTKAIRLLGGENVFMAATQLIESIKSVDLHGLTIPLEIQITSRAPVDIFCLSDWRPDWLKALSTALDHGCNIAHLLPHTYDQARVLAFVQNLIALFGSHRGHYTPMCLPAGSSLDRTHEYVVVPERGVLEIDMPSEEFDDGWHNDLVAHLVLPGHPRYRQLMTEYTNLSGNSTPILTVHSEPITSPDFTKMLCRTENYETDRCMVLDGVSEILVP